MRASLLCVCATIAGAGVLATAGVVAAQDDPLAELAALGDAMADTGPEGGGSIRAKREVDPAIANRKKDSKNVEAKVEQLQTGKFPNVAVKIKVLKPSKDGAGKDIGRNEDIVIVPVLKVDGGKVSMEDEPTRINAGAFYLQVGDKVMVRLGEKKGKLWEAAYIERK